MVEEVPDSTRAYNSPQSQTRDARMGGARNKPLLTYRNSHVSCARAPWPVRLDLEDLNQVNHFGLMVHNRIVWKPVCGPVRVAV
jgi:hypothetical protein